MTKVLFFVAILLCLQFVSADDDDDKKCEPNSHFMIDCNRCRCSRDGLSYWCTRMACVDFTKRTKRQAVEEQRHDDAKSTEIRPAEHKVEDAAKQEEPKQEENAEATPENGTVCTPGDVKHEDCNRCKCANNGIGWWCTRNECPTRRRRHPLIP
uniref:Putative secreted protein n=1 Tax=Lutzomyia longipalpis TaxID=7200 RepID=A0A7G3APZ3_LUTLO